MGKNREGKYLSPVAPHSFARYIPGCTSLIYNCLCYQIYRTSRYKIAVKSNAYTFTFICCIAVTKVDMKFTEETKVYLQCFLDSVHRQYSIHTSLHCAIHMQALSRLEPATIVLIRRLARSANTWDMDTKFHGPLSSI